MQFLAPLFLVGLTALAIPVLVHLSHRTKKEAIPFPSLMFLSKVPYRTVRRQQIRHWLLFLMRSVAVVLLVMAFARPLFNSLSLGGAVANSAREVVVMVDRSFSMGYGDRWERAVAAAHEVIDGLGPDDRASIVLFADRVEIANQPTGDRIVLSETIDNAEVGPGATQYAPPLQAAARILEASNLPNREAVLITDFQRSGWDDREDVRLPQGVILTALDVGEDQVANAAVSGLTVDRILRSDRERVALSARVVNLGKDAVRGLGIKLQIDGKEVGARSVDLVGKGSATVRFASFAMPPREVRGVVRIAGDALAADDTFRFVLSPGRVVSILILEHAGARNDESLYLSRALAIGNAPRYRVTAKKITRFRASDLAGRSAVILNDAPFPRGARGRSLKEFVAAGGGMLVVLGQRNMSRWPAEFAAMLPGEPRGPVDRLNDRGGTLNLTDYDHPVLEVFDAPRSGDFSQARFFRYRRFDGTDNARVLARFDDGAIALAEVRVDDGVVMTWSSGLADKWNDFPLQPVFLPFIHQLVRYLAHYAPAREWFTVGQVLDLGEAFGDSVEEVVVESPLGERWAQRLESGRRYLELGEPGFYEVEPLGGGSAPPVVVAVNAHVSESDLSRVDPEVLAAAVTSRGAAGDGGRALAAALTPAEKERKQGVWWYLLMSALVMLLAETAISNRISRGHRSGSR
ncbi:MAG: BatA domain-containing protein [Gemmatimonadales bacterium]